MSGVLKIRGIIGSDINGKAYWFITFEFVGCFNSRNYKEGAPLWQVAATL